MNVDRTLARRLVAGATIGLFMAASFALGFLWAGLQPAPPTASGVDLILDLYKLDGYVCGPWRPTGQSCASGCYWQRTCYSESGQFTQTSCRSQAGAYCPLSTPGTTYGPEDTALNAWATVEWGGTWSTQMADWVRSDGKTLQEWVEVGE